MCVCVCVCVCVCMYGVSLHNKKMDNPLILQLLEKLHYLSGAHKTIHLCWIPSHIGIRGNEQPIWLLRNF